MWYAGYPALIYYSKFYGNKPPKEITMKQLESRRKQIDEHIQEQIEIITAMKDVIELVRKSPQITDRILSIFNQNKNRMDKGLNDLRDEWALVDAAIEQYKDYQEKKSV
jgi:hypothetical protein